MCPLQLESSDQWYYSNSQIIKFSNISNPSTYSNPHLFQSPNYSVLSSTSSKWNEGMDKLISSYDIFNLYSIIASICTFF